MGAINYRTSEYITLGINPYDYDDFVNDPDFMEWYHDEMEDCGISLDDCVYEEMNRCYERDRENIEAELSSHDFHYFHFAIVPGYYEGFTLDIEPNYPIAFDDYVEKLEAQKEITTIRQFLIDCAGMGLVQCFPGWCTGYSDYKETVKGICEAVKAMREDVRSTPTWAKYNRESA